MDDDVNRVTCYNCGIAFGFSKEVEKAWRDSNKTFFCPNGHPLTWKPENNKEKLVKELRDKLAAAEKELEVQKKKVTELLLELEIWKPTTKEN